MISPEQPRWIRDLLRFLPLRSQFVLSGNVRDQYPVPVSPGAVVPLPLVQALAEALRAAGVVHFLAYDPARGFTVPPVGGLDRAAEHAFLAEHLGLTWNQNNRVAASTERFFEIMETVATGTSEPVALFADFASRLLVRADLPTDAEQRGFTRALVLSHAVKPRPVGTEGRPFFNPILWIVDKEGDLPDWFVVGNPRLRHIPVPRPDHAVRRTVANSLGRTLPGSALTPEETERQLTTFVESTEGLLVADLAGIAQLCRQEGLGLAGIGEAVRRYKLGVTEDPWRQIDRVKLQNAEALIRRRVKGQTHAVTHLLDTIKRAVSGLAVREGGGGRPRGVAFLAGPTGVGKTELAKTVAELLFGDEAACIRFDMSEFSAEHSDQRLIGAPPGYVGYDVGGELTNAIRQRPFSVVLFDEIEKAHPRILDKFLQVLDDGVLTSGRGERVYFSEALLIFTSNLGIYRADPATGERTAHVLPAEPFADVERKVRGEIARHFKETLGRPEILNRIGENIIVFDFIREPLAREIYASLLQALLERVREAREITVRLMPEAEEALRRACLADISNGGRGIRNQLEAHFVNPLARVLFDAWPPAGSTLEITDLKRGAVTELGWQLA